MYVVYCLDKENSTELRLENRQAHLEYLKQYSNNIVLAGPLQSDDLSKMIGSILVLDLKDRDQLDSFLENDPYKKADLFASVTIHPFKKVLP